VPIEPPPSPWLFADPDDDRYDDLVGLGADLEPGTLLAAYRQALFPMPVDREGPIGWWSPDPRGIVPLDGLRVSRSLRASCALFELRVDTAFADVIAACADRRRPHGWITEAIVDAYTELHRLGWAHSVEAWSAGGELAGGLYGVAIGGLFAGESMFADAPDASKVAFVTWMRQLQRWGFDFVDCQVHTEHLARFGAVEISREDYLAAIAPLVDQPWEPGRWTFDADFECTG